MRSAELLGLTPNGKFLLVVTDAGEELAIAADDRLRAALRGDRPRLGQLENEMDSALTPREIQTRVRAGEDVDDVARAAGMAVERVERFAAPVLAERDHIARQAMASSVRRRGETSAHRNLRNVVNERLLARGIELAGVEWGAFRQADGRWIVTATYPSGRVEHHTSPAQGSPQTSQAQFSYDPLGRFSLAVNEEAHWVLGDSSRSLGPSPVHRSAEGHRGDPHTEPTLDLSDELALVRVVQDAEDSRTDHGTDQDGTDQNGTDQNGTDQTSAHETSTDKTRTTRGAGEKGAVENTIPVPPLRVVEGGWEPPIVVDYPIEPGPAEDASDEPTRTDAPTDVEDRRDEQSEFDEEHQGRPVEGRPDPPPIPETPPTPGVQRPTRRKRASVPSWDEIMFGGRDGSGR